MKPKNTPTKKATAKKPALKKAAVKQAATKQAAAGIAGGKLTAAQKRKCTAYITAKREADAAAKRVANAKDEVAMIVTAHGGKVLHQGAELTCVEGTRYKYPSLEDEAQALKEAQQAARDAGEAQGISTLTLRMRDTTGGKEVKAS